MVYLYIYGTVFFTVYGQIVIKWRMNSFDGLPGGFVNNSLFLLKLLFDPFIMSGLVAALIAAMFWMAAMTKADISYAYPFMGLSFVLVLIVSSALLGETFTIHKVMGLVFVLLGIYISSRSI